MTGRRPHATGACGLWHAARDVNNVPMLRALTATLILTSLAFAGGGPETTLVVVNGKSPMSRRIANTYRALRGIPDSHLLVLDSVSTDGIMPLAAFKTDILIPIREYLKKTGLQDRIDLIAYSTDFPYAIDFRKELGNDKPGHQIGGQASLTGVTYLYRQVLADEPFWEILRGQKPRETNRYFRLGFSGGRQLTGGGAGNRAPGARRGAGGPVRQGPRSTTRSSSSRRPNSAASGSPTPPCSPSRARRTRRSARSTTRRRAASTRCSSWTTSPRSRR